MTRFGRIDHGMISLRLPAGEGRGGRGEGDPGDPGSLPLRLNRSFYFRLSADRADHL
jgi:hypothetical protein